MKTLLKYSIMLFCASLLFCTGALSQTNEAKKNKKPLIVFVTGDHEYSSEATMPIIAAALEKDYVIFLTADHGNADYLINEDGSPNTAHTLNPVPLFVIDKNWKGEVKPGKLGDIAPTILTFMRLPLPAEMTGNILAMP